MLNRVNGVLNLGHIHRARAIVALPRYSPYELTSLAGASPSISYTPPYAHVRPFDRYTERKERGIVDLILERTESYGDPFSNEVILIRDP